MNSFRPIFRESGLYPRVTDDECDALIDQFEINDERGDPDRHNLAEAFFWQFWAHWTFNTTAIGGVHRNLYFGDMTGHFGAYPPARMNSAIMKDGRFLLHEGSLPSLRSDDDALREITPDEHRNNENRVLAAWHLALARLHNQRMDIHGDFDTAFDEVVAAFNKAALHALGRLLGMDTRELLDVRVSDAHLSAEAAFQFLRFGHPMMPETFAGRPLFDKTIRAAAVPMVELLNEPAAKIGMRMCQPMIDGSEGGKGRSILFHTIKTRHNEMRLVPWGDVARKYGVRSVPNPACPVFFGMLEEAQDGAFGTVGSRLIADGVVGTLKWGQNPRKGVWDPEPDDLPCTVADIIEATFAPRRSEV